MQFIQVLGMMMITMGLMVSGAPAPAAKASQPTQSPGTVIPFGYEDPDATATQSPQATQTPPTVIPFGYEDPDKALVNDGTLMPFGYEDA